MKEQKSVLIIGAGISGLFLCLELCKKGKHVVLLEKNSVVGGIATSILYNGYSLDIGPHYVTLPKYSEITKNIMDIVGKDKIVQLPHDIRRSRKAYFHGKMWNEYPSIKQFLLKSGLKIWLRVIIDLIKVKIIYIKSHQVISSKDYLISNYGKYLYDNWFKPYYHNIFFDKELKKEEVEKKFPPLDVKKIFNVFRIKKQLQKSNKEKINKEYFNCYFKGGMRTLVKGLEKEIIKNGGRIETDVDIKYIKRQEYKKILFVQNNKHCEIESSAIVYALPLNIVKKWFSTKSELLSENDEDNLLSSIMVFLFIDKPKIFDKWIIDVYDTDIIFWRISQQSFLSESVTPPNKTLLNIEIRVKENSSTWWLSDELLFNRVRSDLIKIGILNKQKIENYKILKLRNLYPLDPNKINNEKVKKLINSLKNEYIIGTELDTGTLISEIVENNTSITRAGGVLTAIYNAKSLVKNIIPEIE